jgi:hypothetical protein
LFGLGINIYSGEDLPLNESDFLTEEEKVLSEKNKEKEKLDRIIKVIIFCSPLFRPFKAFYR